MFGSWIPRIELAIVLLLAFDETKEEEECMSSTPRDASVKRAVVR